MKKHIADDLKWILVSYVRVRAVLAVALSSTVVVMDSDEPEIHVFGNNPDHPPDLGCLWPLGCKKTPERLPILSGVGLKVKQ